MFEDKLKEKFERIFKIKKVTYEQPSEAKEQTCLWIDIADSQNVIKDGTAVARVEGTCTVFGRSDALPFGFFSKAIQEAAPSDTIDLFFFDFEQNTKYYQNLVQRDFSFVYFFKDQYDPEQGELTELELNEI